MEVLAIYYHMVNKLQHPKSSCDLHNVFLDSVYNATSKDNKPTSSEIVAMAGGSHLSTHAIQTGNPNALLEFGYMMLLLKTKSGRDFASKQLSCNINAWSSIIAWAA